MSINIDKISGSKVKFEVNVTKEQFDKALDVAFEKVSKEVDIKGFRKGKVPRSVFEQKFGVESLYEEAINHVVGESYFNTITENKIEVVAQPKIDFDVTKVEQGKDFKYTVEVAVKPEIELGEYKGLSVKKESDEVTEEEVQKELESTLQKHAELVLKEEGSLEKDDSAVFDFEGFVDNVPFEGGKAENYELVMGSGQFIPGFEDQMIGMNPGEEKDINVTFPENYQAENLKGKDAVFKVKLHEIKQRQIPSLDDEFVKELNQEGINTVDELKADAKTKLYEAKASSIKNKMIDTVVEMAASNAKFELPEEMIDEEAKRMMDNTTQQAKQYGLDLDTYLTYTGMNKEQFEANLKVEATKSLRYNLVIEEISKQENITATDEEVNEKYDELVKQYNMEIDQIKASVPEYAIKQEVVFKKTIDFLVESANIEE